MNSRFWYNNEMALLVCSFTSVRDLIGLRLTSKLTKKPASNYWVKRLPARLRLALQRSTPLFVSDTSAQLADAWKRVSMGGGFFTDINMLRLIENENTPPAELKDCLTWVYPFAHNTFWKLASSNIPHRPYTDVILLGGWTKVDNVITNISGESTTNPEDVCRVGGMYKMPYHRRVERTANEKYGRQHFDAIALDVIGLDVGSLFSVDMVGVSFDGKTLTIPSIYAFYHKVARTQSSPTGTFFLSDVYHTDKYHDLLCEMGYSFLHSGEVRDLIARSCGDQIDQEETHRIMGDCSPEDLIAGFEDESDQFKADLIRIHGDVQAGRTRKIKEWREKIKRYASEPVLTNFITGLADAIKAKNGPAKKQRVERKKFV